MSGTYVDKRVPRWVMSLFLAAALAIVAVPSIGMLWARTDSTTENRELAPAPSITAEDGSVHVGFLSDAGDYFDDHFAYRNEMVALNARIRASLGSSSTDQVIVGSDGWLYYAGTLNDYLGRSVLSDRTLANIAHNLQLVQGYVQDKGAAFAFAIAPNKNTLYDEHMPSQYVRYPGDSNAERLKPFLEQAGVVYVDLFDMLSNQDDTLYLKRDTHWDNRGALLAANAMLHAIGRAPVSVSPSPALVIDDFAGDLQGMLFPGGSETEANYYFQGYHEQASGDTPLHWRYVEGADVADSLICTAGSGEGTLYLFRDSFGNALVPFMAAAFDSATFSKLVPYNIPAASQAKAGAVVIERAERHVSDLATTPPFIPNPTLSFSGDVSESAREVGASFEVSVDGSYWVIRGTVEEPLNVGDRLYLRVQQPQAPPIVYDPFWVSFADDDGIVGDDGGFLVYVPTSAFDADAAEMRVYVR